MDHILQKNVEEIAHERAKWIDDTIQNALPAWKRKLLLRFPNRLLAKLIFASPEIYHETLIADFGTRTIIMLNGKIIGEGKYVV